MTLSISIKGENAEYLHFYIVILSVGILTAIMLGVIMLGIVAFCRGLYYKTFYGSNLRIFVIS